jgi:chromosome segregation ATPase
MSFEKVDQYIKELEAIKNYDKVKNENTLLLTKVRELESKLSSERKRVEELLQINKSLENEIKVKIKEIESLRNEVSVKGEKIKKLEEELNNLVSRVRELEEIKTLTEGRTLKEAEEQLLKAKEDEVKRLAKELFNQWKSE